jgi:hypothetical protein
VPQGHCYRARHDLISGRKHPLCDRLAMLEDGKRAVYSIALAEPVKEGALTSEDRIKFCRKEGGNETYVDDSFAHHFGL